MNKFNIIKEKVSIIDILSKYSIKVVNGFICCPIHNEETPSCKIYEKTNTFHCFGCGASGDVVNFVALVEKTDNNTAAKIIDEWFGLDLSKPLTKQERIEFIKQEKERNKQAQQRIKDEKLKKDILRKIIKKMRACEKWLINKNILTTNMCIVLKELKRLNFIYDSVADLTTEDGEYEYTIGSKNVFNLIKQNKIKI